MNKHLNNIEDKYRVRVLQPASHFYNNLMETWILIKQKNPFEKVNLAFKINFDTDFLPRVKETIGNFW